MKQQKICPGNQKSTFFHRSSDILTPDPKLHYCTHAEQVEIIAELFRIGMLYGTSYPTADARDYTDPDFERKVRGFFTNDSVCIGFSREERRFCIMIEAILVERDYKGSYERLALTYEEFQKAFSAYPELPPPTATGSSFTLKPMVHIWYRSAAVGDDAWTQFFTDMTAGLPQTDIIRGNHAYIRKDLMQSLCAYLPQTLNTPSLDARIDASHETAPRQNKAPLKPSKVLPEVDR